MKFRMLRQSRDHYPHAIYSGTTNYYVLQCREDGTKPWETVPMVDFDSLPQAEKDAVIKVNNDV